MEIVGSRMSNSELPVSDSDYRTCYSSSTILPKENMHHHHSEWSQHPQSFIFAQTCPLPPIATSGYPHIPETDGPLTYSRAFDPSHSGSPFPGPKTIQIHSSPFGISSSHGLNVIWSSLSVKQEGLMWVYTYTLQNKPLTAKPDINRKWEENNRVPAFIALPVN